MARRSMTVYVNGYDEENRVRTFGGNGSDVRNMMELYKNMTKEEFLRRHPKFADMCKEKFFVHVFYSR